jgi:hypothetical protein
MALSRLIVLLVVALSAASCSSGNAFVERNYLAPGVRKQKLPGFDGHLTVCHGSDTPRQQRDHMAAEACGVYGLEPVLVSERPWQCRFTVPHIAEYGCVDPAMRFEDGGYVNPFSPDQVEKWRAQQAEDKAAAKP